MAQDTLGTLLSILRDGQPRTRAELVQLTGLARSTVSQRLDALLFHRWIVPAEHAISSGGRPSTAFAFNPRARIVLAVDLGVTHARLAVTDLSGSIVAERTCDVAIAQGPEPSLNWLLETFTELLAGCGHRMADVCGAGVGLPGPVEHDTGRPVNPPLMPGWDGFSVADWLGSRIGAPVLVDNDVNIMALGEHSAAGPQTDHLLFTKVGTGIGCGIISGGRLHRGARGAAGDIGHIRVPGSEVVCHCGNTGCLEAVAGGGAVAARLRAEELEAADARDVVRLVRAGNTWAIRQVRQSGRDLGLVLASIVNFFNPTEIVIGGDLADAGEHLIAGIREAIYGRSLPLATQWLNIRASDLGASAGVTGAASMIIEHVLTPESVEQSIRS
ncbi:ROK family transcriptional regulator [Nonomuraea cypriaca]|uniref:ROK family transcriptional regulator n=1 Tax=Nonomuraea cypriaca TaxID=1187855 RepID=UPI001F399018|nr:ROK family protein [Nonomuraea cypriaca]